MAKPALEFFDPDQGGAAWRAVDGDATGALRELVLAVDPDTGHATRLLRFQAGADTTPNGIVVHDFWEEVWILDGAIRDLRLGREFTAGMYACRPPGMEHGPWVSPAGATTFEVRYRLSA